MKIAVAGIVIFLFSVVGGWVLVQRQSPQQEKQVKAVLFGLYFWGLAFLQLLIAATVYYFYR